MFFTDYLPAVISGLIIGFAYRKRAEIGPAAGNLAYAAGIVMLVNGVLVATAISFVGDMATDWASLGEEVPLAWRITQNALTPLSAIMDVAAVGFLAMAVFVPRPAARASQPT
ncbi:hypothetical protein AB0B66_22850 [Catellatospora sp. NPDC049111]|uniref:hypothetical protein n=1 Tax=Catellatospora sp. NPDC049111 TaxID=3155271 RepID=UPI0033F7337B